MSVRHNKAKSKNEVCLYSVGWNVLCVCVCVCVCGWNVLCVCVCVCVCTCGVYLI